jgi:hypothetical protein
MQPFYLNSAHQEGTVSITGCLFHFKLIASLEEKAKEEKVRQQHYANGREYKQYREGLEIVLYEEGLSVRYESPQQLIDLGLMSPGGWA